MAGAESRGLRIASIVLFWCTAAATVIVVLALANRRSVWTDLVDGNLGFGDIQRIDDADSLVSTGFALAFVLGLATLIVVSIWSLRVGRRAQRTGAPQVSPGLACGSWYIPYASAIVPFIQLRRIARHWRRPTAMLGLWQAFYIVAWVAGTGLSGLEPSEDDVFADVSDVTDQLNAQLLFGVLTLIAVLVMAFAAMQAVRSLDES